MCKKKGPKRDHFSRTKKEKGPFQQDKKEKKDFCVKKGPKKDHFSSLVLKRTKSLIKDLYGSTGAVPCCITYVSTGQSKLCKFGF